MLITLQILLVIICIEAVTEIITDSSLFQPVKKFFFTKENRLCMFIHDLLDCGYCLSVWVSLIIITYLSILNLWVVDIFNCNLLIPIYVFSFHRLSNLIHIIIGGIYARIFKEY